MKKSVAIELDKIRNLRIGINAMSMAEGMLGKPLSEMSKGMGIRDIHVLLYCGLIWEEKALTLESVGDLLDDAVHEKGIEYLGEKIGEALELAFPDKKKLNQLN